MKGWLKPVEADETVLPVSIETVKGHLRVDGEGEDDLIEAYILAAAREFERQTSRGMFPTLYEWRLDQWPCDGTELPYGPVREVTSLAWVDEEGETQEVDEANWTYALSDRGARLVYAEGFTPPALGRAVDGVIVSFRAGHDPRDDAASESEEHLKLPRSADLALLLMVAHWYQNREAAAAQVLTEIPLGAAQIMSGLRIFR